MNINFYNFSIGENIRFNTDIAETNVINLACDLKVFYSQI